MEVVVFAYTTQCFLQSTLQHTGRNLHHSRRHHHGGGLFLWCQVLQVSCLAKFCLGCLGVYNLIVICPLDKDWRTDLDRFPFLLNQSLLQL